MQFRLLSDEIFHLTNLKEHVVSQENAEGHQTRSRRMPHLIGDVAEGVWKNSLLSKVIRLET